MKKKFIAVYALIGVLALGSTALTSCVDDNESASVTAIRDAKAQQLAALAAQANAYAKYYEAQAAVEEAIAAGKLIDNEKAAAELEKLKADYEKAMQDAEHYIITQLQDHQKALYSNYKKAQQEAVNLRGEITEKKLNIVQLETGVADAEAMAAKFIHDEELTIAKETAKKETYQAMGENNYEDLAKQLEEANIDLENKKNDVTAKLNALTAARLAYDNALAQNIEGGDVKSEYTEPESGEVSTQAEDKLTSVEVESPLKTVNAINALTAMAEETEETEGTISLSVLRNGEEIKVSDDAEYNEYNYTLQELDANAVAIAKKELTDAVESKKDLKGTDKDKAADYGTIDWDNTKNGKELYDAIITTLNSSEEATAYAKLKAFQDVIDDLNDEVKGLDEDAENYDDQKAELDERIAIATSAQDFAKDAKTGILAEADKEIAAAQKVLDEFNANIALLDANSADYKAYKAAVESLINNEGKAIVTATEEHKAAQLAQVIAQGEVEALEDLVGTEGTVQDITKKILACDEEIVKAQSNIKLYENLLLDENGNEVSIEESKQVLLEKTQAELQDLNDKLAIAEAAKASWKEQLEASLNGTAAPAPETPAEGEETPAA